MISHIKDSLFVWSKMLYSGDKDTTTYQHEKDNSRNLSTRTSCAAWPYGLSNTIVVCTNEKACSLSFVIAKLKSNVLPLVQTTIRFGNPCYSERLRDVSFFRLKLVDK